MPGKYSHSVVLADYSTRGVIFLPQDQYDKYKDSVQPSPQRQIRNPARLPRVRSAQTIYQPPRSTQEGWDTVKDRPRPSLSTNATPTRERTYISPVEYGGQHQHSQPVQGSDRLPPASYSTDRAQSTVSRFENSVQMQRSPTVQSDKPVTRPTAHSGIDNHARPNLLTPEEKLIHPALRNTESNTSLRKDAVASRLIERQIVRKGKTSNHSSSSETLAGSSVRATPVSSRKPSTSTEPATDTKVMRQEQNESPKTATSLNKERYLNVGPGNAPSSIRGSSQRSTSTNLDDKSSLQPHQSRNVPNVLRSHSSESRISRITQIWSPEPEAMTEPNFNGFTDQEASPQHYSEGLKQFKGHSKSDSTDTTLPIQRPQSPEEPNQRTKSTAGTPTASARSNSLRGDRDTPSRATASSTLDSWHRRPNSSVSSVGSPKDNLYGFGDKFGASPTSQHKHSAIERGWVLPNIEEDIGFSPSIFEDKEGKSNKLDFDVFDFEQAMGRISSGKDVSFDDDAASDLSAALPPPISRFKDEEDEFNANMSKLFGSSSEKAAKKGSQPIPRRSSIKKGFFSKLRSKS